MTGQQLATSWFRNRCRRFTRRGSARSSGSVWGHQDRWTRCRATGSGCRLAQRAGQPVV